MDILNLDGSVSRHLSRPFSSFFVYTTLGKGKYRTYSSQAGLTPQVK